MSRKNMQIAHDKKKKNTVIVNYLMSHNVSISIGAVDERAYLGMIRINRDILA